MGSPPAPAAPPTPQVTVATPLVQQVLDWASYTGRLAAIEEVEVRARVTGYLLSHHFEEGQMVEAGQLLFVIDPRPYEASLAQSRAARAEAVANYRKAEAQQREAQAMERQVQARLDLANTRLRRNRPLVPSGAISEDEFDEMQSEGQQAQADLYAAQAAIESAHAALTAADAAIATADAAIDSAALELSYCRIEAPITGRISRQLVTKGNLISGGSLGAATLTTIVSLDPIHADFDADEQALMKYIRLAQANKRTNSRDAKTPVYMALVDEEGFPHKGYIDFVDNRIDRSTGSIRARAIFPNPDEILTVGAFVRMQVPAGAPGEAVLIPDSAVATDQTTKFVYLLGEGDKIETRPVATGPIAKGLRVIAEGLDGTERVVIRGLQRCRPGATAEATVEEITPGKDDGLPDTYVPVPPEEWLRQPVTTKPAERAAAPTAEPSVDREAVAR